MPESLGDEAVFSEKILYISIVDKKDLCCSQHWLGAITPLPPRSHHCKWFLVDKAVKRFLRSKGINFEGVVAPWCNPLTLQPE